MLKHSLLAQNPATEFAAANLKEKQHLQTLRLAWKSGYEDDNAESGSNQDTGNGSEASERFAS